MPLPQLLKAWLVATLVAVAGLAQAQTASQGAVFHALGNGVRLLIKEDRRAPTVVHMAWIKAGSIDEVNGKTGVAHVLEHMMFKGTQTVPAGEFSRRVAALGGRENAFTSRDVTGYFQQVPKTALAEVMRLESDRMGNLVISDEEFAKEIKVVMEERRWRTEDRATGIVFEQLMAHAFTASPVRHPIVGWMSDLEAMTAQDARDWYQLWYAPANILVVIVGDVVASEVIKLAEQTYGKLVPRALPARKPQVEPAQRGIKRLSVKAPAENPYLIMAYKVPKLDTVEGPVDPYALEMLSAVLAGDETARFTSELVRRDRIANRAGASYDMTSRGPALFFLDITPAQGVSVAQAEQALREQLRKIAQDGVQARELERVRAQYVASQVFQRDSIMSQAYELAGLEMVGLSWRDADRILERIKAVTPEQVQAVAQKFFSDDQLTVVELLPQPIDTNAPRRAPPAGLRHGG
jgi:zinc protease